MKTLNLILAIFLVSFLSLQAQSISELDNELDSLIINFKGKARVFHPEAPISLRQSIIDNFQKDPLIEQNLTFTLGKTEVKLKLNDQYSVYFTAFDKVATITSPDEISEVLKITKLDSEGKDEVLIKFSQIVKMKLEDEKSYSRLKQIVFYLLQAQTVIS